MKKFIRRLTKFAWGDFLFDVARVEWKFGRYDNGYPKNWTEWNNIRQHLKELNSFRNPQELNVQAVPAAAGSSESNPTPCPPLGTSA